MMEATEIKQSTMDYVVSGIRYVCENFKKRGPGTESERKAQDYLAGELRQWADEVTVEEFKLHPLAFMGFMPIAGVFMIVSVILFTLNGRYPSSALPIASVVLALVSVLMFIFEFMLYRKFIDFIFPKKVSKNVFAVRKPTGEVKKRIVFGGHSDAAWEWTYSLHGGKAALVPVIFGAVIGMFFAFITDVIYLVMRFPEFNTAWTVISILQLLLIPFCVAIIFFINWRVVVDGANDNLTACYSSMAVLKELADNNVRFENTEVCCIITGSEEAGLRGAKAFSKAHAKELNKIETVIIPLETIREKDQLAVYNLDETGMVHNDESVCDLLIKAGRNVGIEMHRAPIYPGSTDAAAFTQGGFKSAGLGGVNHDPQTYYHTRHDSWNNISEECIKKAIEICIETAYLYDKEGLKK
jgi:hypothetical protein